MNYDNLYNKIIAKINLLKEFLKLHDKLLEISFVHQETFLLVELSILEIFFFKLDIIITTDIFDIFT